MTDNEFTDLENELRRLRPRAVAPRLMASLAADLETSMPATPERVVAVDHVEQGAMPIGDWIRWVLPIAAAFVFGVLAARFPHGANEATAPGPRVTVTDSSLEPATYKPVLAEKFDYGPRDDGLVTLNDGTTARRLSNQYLDTITWRNPRTNASLRWSVPREEIRVIPISAY
ncbi:MAG: hypothetical protein JNN01_14240 [Opitutaceae bacterium]|nr:hypothetical protein [Opitutaceae bacterium]